MNKYLAFYPGNLEQPPVSIILEAENLDEAIFRAIAWGVAYNRCVEDPSAHHKCFYINGVRYTLGGDE